MTNKILSIYKKLSDIGWGEEVRKIPNYGREILEALEYFKRPKELTDCGDPNRVLLAFLKLDLLTVIFIEWLEMRDDLVSRLEQMKKKRLRNYLDKRILQICESVTPEWPKLTLRKPHDPSIINILMFPELRSLAEHSTDPSIREADLHPVLHTLPQLTARWHKEIKVQLGQKLRLAYEQAEAEGIIQSRPDEVASLVDLACSTLVCSHCGKVLAYPSLIAHVCPLEDYNRLLPVSVSQGGNADEYLEAVVSVTGARPWSPEHIVCKIDTHILAKVQKIAKLCGLDWETVKWWNMDRRKDRFICVCRLCVKSPTTEVMTWRHVVSSHP